MTTATPITFHVALAATEAPGAGPDQPDGGPITMEGLALPWNQTVQLNFWGDTVSFRPGSVAVPEPGRVKFLLDHRAKPFGFGSAFESTPAGLRASMTIPREELADPEVATAVRQHTNGVRDALSVGVAIVAAEETETGEGWDAVTHFDVTEGRLLELSSVVVPRFDDARVDRVAAAAEYPTAASFRAARRPYRKEPTMPALAAPGPEPVPDPDDPSPDDPAEARMAAHRAALHPVTPTAAMARPRGRYESFGHYALAGALGTREAAYERVIEAAWTDEVTGDVPGLMPESWMRDVVDLMGTVSATVDLFSRRPLPDAGMTFHQPVLDQSPDVGPQGAEKTEIASRKVLIGDKPFAVQTFAGGQDISIQTLRRSSPDYLTELMRLYTREMALELNIAANTALVGSAAAPLPLDPADINGSIIDAVLAIGGATYSFAQVLLMGSNVWAAIGKAVDTAGRPLFPTYSPLNPVGSFQLTDANGAVRDLGFALDWSMDPDVAIVGMRDAFRTWTSPMRTLTVDVPRLLGRDVAVYEFAAYGVLDVRGLVKLTLTGAVARSRAAADKK